MASKAQIAAELSDEERVRLFQKTRENRWFSELFEKHRRKVYVACRAFFDDSGRAEDATQETFLRAFQNMDRFREGDFRAWLMKICKNVCIDEWRRRRPEQAVKVEARNWSMNRRGTRWSRTPICGWLRKGCGWR